MNNNKKRFIIDKVLIVAVVAGMFALALVDNLLNAKSQTNTCEIVAKTITREATGLNH